MAGQLLKPPSNDDEGGRSVNALTCEYEVSRVTTSYNEDEIAITTSTYIDSWLGY